MKRFVKLILVLAIVCVLYPTGVAAGSKTAEKKLSKAEAKAVAEQIKAQWLADTKVRLASVYNIRWPRAIRSRCLFGGESTDRNPQTVTVFISRCTAAEAFRQPTMTNNGRIRSSFIVLPIVFTWRHGHRGTFGICGVGAALIRFTRSLYKCARLISM